MPTTSGKLRTYCSDIASAATIRPVILSHGWIYLSPAEMVGNGFRYSMVLPDIGPSSVTVTPSKGKIAYGTDRSLSVKDRVTLLKVIHHMLSLDFPLKEFQKICKDKGDTTLLRLARKGWGRMFRSPTYWEDAVKTLCTTNASWGYTQQMCRRLCDELGETTPSGFKTFPSPKGVIAAGEDFLKKTVGMGYRRKSLVLLAGKAASGDFPWLMDFTLRPDVTTAEKEVRSLYGFGPYAAKHLLVLMGFHEYLPIDREVGKHLGIRKSGDRSRKLDSDHFKDWGNFRFTAYKLTRVASRQNWIGD